MVKYLFQGKVQVCYSKTAEFNPIQFCNLREEYHDPEIYKYCITFGRLTIFWGE